MEHGNFDIIYQIPQILYSTVISANINMILKRLFLSETQMLSIKKEKDFESALNKENQFICTISEISIKGHRSGWVMLS